MDRTECNEYTGTGTKTLLATRVVRPLVTLSRATQIKPGNAEESKGQLARRKTFSMTAKRVEPALGVLSRMPIYVRYYSSKTYSTKCMSGTFSRSLLQSSDKADGKTG